MKQLSPEALLQLAQYQPCRDGGGTREATFRRMVCPVLMENGGRLETPTAVQEAFQILFGVTIEDDELGDWLKHLKEKGAVERDGAAVVVTPEAKALLTDRKQEYDALSTAAKQEWKTSLLEVEPHLTDGELDDLTDDLDTLISKIVAYHGAESAVILYPEEERSDELRNTLLAKREELPNRGEKLNQVRRKGLAAFFAQPTEAQRGYLADRLDHGFFCTVGTLRPEAAGAIKEEFTGQRVYLDTNVLIPALGLAGSRVNRSTRRMLELTSELGVQIAVTPQTIEEFHHSLTRAKGDIVSRGLPSRRYADVLRRAASEGGGVSLTEGYFESYGAQGSSPEEWFRKAAQLKPKLDELGIEVVSEAVESVFKNEGEKINDYVVLLNRAAVFGSSRPRARDDRPMEHDAFHRALVERLRGDGHRQFGSAQYWFLTEDKVLPRFGQLAREGEATPTIPFCISVAAWAQIARCFVPRTDDFDETITDLLASPYLRFGQPQRLGDIQEVVSRITTLLNDASPAVVAAFASDESMESVAGSGGQSEEDDQRLVEAYRQTEDAVEKRLKALGERLSDMEMQLNQEREQHEGESTTADSKHRAVAGALQEERRRSKQLEEDLKRERVMSADEIERLKEDLEEIRVAETERQDRRRRVARLAPKALAGAIVAAAVVLYATNTVSLAVIAVGVACGVALLIGPRLERSRWAYSVALMLGVLGVALTLFQVLGDT